MQPLEGVTVVSFEQAVSAPLATRHLADQGARVIKVERPGEGDFARHYDHTVAGSSAYFVWLNRGKQSIAIDLKDPTQQPVVDRLVELADIVVHNLAPRSAERLGLSPSHLLAQRPAAIACAISGYGSTGPYARRKAYDLLVQCEAAVLAVTGTARTPSKVGISIADIAAGMYAYASILAALVRRERSGEGAAIDVSMFDALVEWMSQPLYATKYGGTAPTRQGPRHASIAPYGPYSTADGATIFIAVQNEREWRRLCRDVLDQPTLAAAEQFAGNEKRVRHRRELEAAINAAVRGLSAEEFTARLDRAEIASARQNSVADLVNHPLLSRAGRWASVTTPGGVIDMLRPPAQIGPAAERSDVPAVGQHTEQILAEIGILPTARTRGSPPD
jgi:itaconate CoA-transferase